VGGVRTVTGEYFWTKDIEPFPVEYTCAPLMTENGISGTVCIFRDVGERIRADKAQQAAAVQTAARQTAERLQEATAALSATMTATEVAAVSTAQAARLLGARAVAIYDAAGRRLDGAGSAILAADAGPPPPAADAARLGEPIWLESTAAWRRRYPDLTARMRPAGPPPTAALPLVVGSRLLGVMSVSFPGEDAMEALDRGTLGALAEQCAQGLERARLYENEREVASTLQRSLLPPPPPAIPGVEVALRYLPAGEGLKAGGDWYDVIALPDGRLGVAVGDVVGRGVQAAAVMGQLQSALRAFAQDGDRPAVVLGKLSRFAERVEQARMATVTYGVLDPETGELVFARAGHPPPLVVGPGGRTEYLHGSRGAPLAAFAQVPHTEGRAVLEPGGMLAMYSDGLIERRRESLDAGLDRLARAVSLVVGETTETVCDRVLSSMFGSRRPADDVALLLLRRTSPIPLVFKRRIDAKAEQLAPLRRELRGWLREAEVDETILQDLVLAVGEALANAVEHAYRPGEHGRIEFRVTLDAEGVLQAAIRDFGRWRPPRWNPDRGRGIGMMEQLTDALDVSTSEEGTHVVMVRRSEDS
jgi:serine phosphatase RsbU (regulator of sigma subunit)/anti-sigma regulatory factor (Ser/Thr protein kinase)